ncbi:sugar O-acetyltransferase [Alphaproteobacteria bacterium KMM 3653]|uniref:Sugar O-acetyltransferase n=1 Tax=Harenicola maris TaxID=2841044 RepID=A0AAP2CT36_9RHOB|nr:sugar O-acetyltransferase [Harenicola maris]
MQDNRVEAAAGGVWYSCLSDELEVMRRAARRACHAHNHMEPDLRGPAAPPLRALFASFANSARVEAPFQCSYGVNIALGEEVFLNTGCVILDSAPVSIGAGSMLGPGVQIYCADHHREPAKRRAGIERALPVRIGEDVWIGGAAVILPGVSIGDGAIVAAGAVVSRDVAAQSRVAGVPARPL